MCLALLLFVAQTASAILSGHWEGSIQLPQQPIAITVDLAPNGAGTWIGSMSVSQSSSRDVPLADLVVDGSTVRFTATLPTKALFEGALATAGNQFTGTASNAEGAVPFQLTRRGDAHVSVPPPSSVLAPAFEGRWQGAIEADGKTRRVALTIAAASDGLATATLVSIDKGNLEIPVTTVRTDGVDLRFESRAVSGAYRGTMNGAGEIVGEWSEGTVHLPLTFRRAAPADAAQ